MLVLRKRSLGLLTGGLLIAGSSLATAASAAVEDPVPPSAAVCDFHIDPPMVTIPGTAGNDLLIGTPDRT